jgi:hypothetical protein
LRRPLEIGAYYFQSKSYEYQLFKHITDFHSIALSFGRFPVDSRQSREYLTAALSLRTGAICRLLSDEMKSGGERLRHGTRLSGRTKYVAGTQRIPFRIRRRQGIPGVVGSQSEICGTFLIKQNYPAKRGIV